MANEGSPPRNWFDQGGRAYSLFRPEYPPDLARFLVHRSPSPALALDVGCGTGQLSRQLATHFARVIAIDPSEDQLANALQTPRIEYVCATAEKLPIADASVSLIAAAQAAHWFNLPRFFSEVRRVAVPHALVALVSYGVLQLGNVDLQQRFLRFYGEELRPYWPPERRLVDDGYAGLQFPFAEEQAPAMAIKRSWALGEMLGYLSTWSAVRRVDEAEQHGILDDFVSQFSDLWGDPNERRMITWPIKMRLGRA